MMQNQELEKKNQSEAIFHDKKYSDHQSFPFHYSINPTYKIFKEMKTMLGDVSGKQIVEYGCGTGWVMLELAEMGGIVSGFDISKEAIVQSGHFLESQNVSNCDLRIMGAESLEYDDNSFDIAFGFAILHHLNLDLAIKELFRILKPGGTAYFAEPLSYNPIINFYRKLTPSYRTADERPLSFSDIDKFKETFQSVFHREYYLVSILGIAFVYVPLLRKYCDKIISYLSVVDNYLYKVFPFLRKYSWYSVLVLRKASSAASVD